MRSLLHRGATVAAIVVVLAVGGSAALAGTGIGATFNLGQVNRVDALSTLTGTFDGKMLLVKNNGTGASAAGIGITVPAGKAPLAVNGTAGKATNLNADRLDGKNAIDFYAAGSKVADSEQLDGMDSAAFLQTTGKAADSELLDGMDSTAFLQASGKAADSDLLDGKDSSQFVQGNGALESAAVAVPAGSFFTIMETPEFRVAYSCPATDVGVNNGTLRLRILADQTVNYFSDNGGSNPNQFGQLSQNDVFDQGAAASGEHVTFSVQGTFIATIQVFSVHRAGVPDCHVQTQATISR